MSWNLKDLEKTLLIGSTLVEGSTLSEKEAQSVLAGKTVQGHPISEIRELLNYRSSVEWLIQQFDCSPYLSRDLLLDFHRKLFQGFGGEHGRWKTLQNYTYLSSGKRHDYEQPAQVESLMRKWIDQFNLSSFNEKIAVHLYYEFQQIHPFEDGNGRIGRILIAYWLHWKNGSSFEFRLADKTEHLMALEAANESNFDPLILFFKKRTKKGK